MSDLRLPHGPESLSDSRHSGVSPFVIFGVIDGLTQMTIVEVKRTGLTHPGLRRVFIQCVLLVMELLIIANRSGSIEKGLAAPRYSGFEEFS